MIRFIRHWRADRAYRAYRAYQDMPACAGWSHGVALALRDRWTRLETLAQASS